MGRGATDAVTAARSASPTDRPLQPHRVNTPRTTAIRPRTAADHATGATVITTSCERKSLRHAHQR
jgi:hypothetical protein